MFKIVDGPDVPFYLKMVRAGPHRNLHYAFGDADTGRATLVDPAFELEPLFDSVEGDGFKVCRALFTHGHWDHIGGADACAKRGVEEMIIHEKGTAHPKLLAAAKHGATIVSARDGQRFDMDGVPVELLHTPGHQPEGACFLVGASGGDKLLFGGDTLFVGSCGRTDFAGGNTAHMFASMARLRSLAGTTGIHVMPGHDYGEAPWRRLSGEVDENPALSTTNRKAFEALPCLNS